MKKALCLLFASGWLLVGCSGENISSMLFGTVVEEKFSYNEAYAFSHVTFTTSDKTKIEDLAKFLPEGENITSVADFEAYIKANLDTYSLVQNDLQTITFLENNQARVVYKGETHTVSATLQPEFEDKRFIVGNRLQTQQFFFDSGYIYYSIAFTDNFKINYIFDNK